MEPRSLSVAIAFLVTLILALLPRNADHSKATAATEKHGGPPELIHVHLTGRDGDKVTLALQPHDFSLAGFTNRSHHWYTFPGYEHVILNGTTLPFGNTYRDLIGGLANLPTLPLGREPTLRAMATMAVCDLASTDGHGMDALKRALATLTVTNCESLRLTPVKETISDGWESGDARLTERHLRYIEHWDTICFEINRARKTGEWNGPFTELLKKSANIHSLDEAHAVVGVVVSPSLDQVLMAHARSA